MTEQEKLSSAYSSLKEKYLYRGLLVTELQNKNSKLSKKIIELENKISELKSELNTANINLENLQEKFVTVKTHQRRMKQKNLIIEKMGEEIRILTKKDKI